MESDQQEEQKPVKTEFIEDYSQNPVKTEFIEDYSENPVKIEFIEDSSENRSDPDEEPLRVKIEDKEQQTGWFLCWILHVWCCEPLNNKENHFC